MITPASLSFGMSEGFHTRLFLAGLRNTRKKD
jgi:hypothetical protein